MTGRRFLRAVIPPSATVMTALFFGYSAGAGDLSEPMRAGIPGAKPVQVFSTAQLAHTVQVIMKLDALPTLSAVASLTPNAPYGTDGAYLSVWKPSFLIGTATGGEVGINFWNIYNAGHVNVGFTPAAGMPTLMDCRLLSAGKIDYKIYAGDPAALSSEAESAIASGHLLLIVPRSLARGPISVELWPAPINSTVGFLGCDLWTIA